MAYPMFPLVSAPASYMPVPVDLVQRLASFTLAHPGEPGGLTADEIRHLNLPCGSYGYESEVRRCLARRTGQTNSVKR